MCRISLCFLIVSAPKETPTNPKIKDRIKTNLGKINKNIFAVKLYKKKNKSMSRLIGSLMFLEFCIS